MANINNMNDINNMNNNNFNIQSNPPSISTSQSMPTAYPVATSPTQLPVSDNILNITFNAHTIDGIIASNEKYKPSMSSPLVYSQFPNILFVPSIKITEKMLRKYSGEGDIKKIFLSPSQLNTFIENVKKDRLYKPITLVDAQKRGIIYQNIKLILDMFFKKGDAFVINDSSYVINNYNWDNKYKLTTLPDRNSPSVDISIDIYLHKGKQLSFTDSTRINCMQKKEQIIREYYQLVGLDLDTTI